MSDPFPQDEENHLGFAKPKEFDKSKTNTTISDKKYAPIIILVLAFFFALAAYGVNRVEVQIKNNLNHQLRLTLAANVESLRLFFNDKKLDALVLVSQPEIHKNIVSLIQLSEKEDLPAEVFRESTPLIWLREHLGKACEKYGFIGFVIFDSTGFQVGARLEEPVGKRQLIERSIFFYQSMQGDTVVSNPFPGEVRLPDTTGKFLHNGTTQFVSTPVKDQNGKILGVLAFRLRPQMEFERVMSVSRFGETGETYAFNEDGVLVSKSRFEGQLISMGLIQPGETSSFNIQIRDPGRNLQENALLNNETIDDWPFTKMAESALQKKSGVNVEGYNDYRGVPVIGVWTWMDDQNLGIATEIDSEEAFAPLNTLLFWYHILFGLLVIAVIMGLFMRSRELKTRKQKRENENRLNLLTKIISDPIIAIDERGIIKAANPAVQSVFGYSASEILGENIKILMPEPYANEYQNYLDNYLKTGKKKVINLVKEVTGLRKIGSTFPMELSVSESFENGKKVFVGILRDISERKEIEKAIDAANQEKNLILNTAGEGIFGLDLEGITTFANSSACKMLGYKEEELVGKAQHALIHHSYPDGTHFPREDCPIYAAFKDGKDHQESEEVFWRKDGSSFPVEYMSRPITDGGKIKGAVVTFTDITTRRAAELELQQAYHVLEERIAERTQELNSAKELAETHNQAKSEFLSRMSHELRTPMNAILGFAQIMNESKKNPLPDTHKARLAQILKAGNHLLELINEVLDLARVEAGKITVSVEPVNIAELTSDVLNVIRPMANKFNIRLIDHITTHKDVFVLADKTRLKQILLNLASNGIKYNRKAGSLTFSVEKQEGNILDIHLKDTGMGISSEQLEKIFDPFDRLGAESTEVEGTGIGMTISKKLIELMNGQIRIKSTPGEGSQFSVSLPTCESTILNLQESPEFHENHFPEVSNKHLTLLYIEDNKANMLLVQDLLSDYLDINLLTAPHAVLGLDLAHAHQPDLILLDINLPDIDGFETLKRLQNMEETHNIPVIAISANAMQSDINKALEAGFKSYMTKPINIIQFKRILEKYLVASPT